MTNLGDHHMKDSSNCHVFVINLDDHHIKISGDCLFLQTLVITIWKFLVIVMFFRFLVITIWKFLGIAMFFKILVITIGKFLTIAIFCKSWLSPYVNFWRLSYFVANSGGYHMKNSNNCHVFVANSDDHHIKSSRDCQESFPKIWWRLFCHDFSYQGQKINSGTEVSYFCHLPIQISWATL